MSAIDRRSLATAYRNARYHVDTGAAELVLRVGEPSVPAAALLAAHGAAGAAYLTAHNPGSRCCDEQTNAAAQQALREALEDYHVLAGTALDPSGRWPPEDSLLVLDIPLPEARVLAGRFGQNALLWVDTRGMPELVWVEGP